MLMKFVRLILISLLFYTSAAYASAPEVLWNYESPGGHVDASPALGVLKPGGELNIVVGTTAGVIVALTEKGSEVWRSEVDGPACISPSIGDMDGDGAPEVLAMTQAGSLYCLEGATGQKRWQFALPGRINWGETALTLMDLAGDGGLHVVTGDKEGNVVCVNASGEMRWIFREDMGVVQAPAAADLTGDGVPEILVAGNKVPLICLSARGEELWRIPSGVGASPVISDMDGDGIPEIITGISQELVLLNTRGEILWKYPMRLSLDSAITVTDLDGDGVSEIVAIDLAGELVCLSAEGKKRWEANVVDRVRRSPSVGDLNGDGILEIVVAGYSGALHIFRADGTEMIRYPVSGGMNTTATLLPLSDGGPGVLIAPANSAMTLIRFPGAKADASLPWREYRQNAMRTAFAQKDSVAPAVKLSLDPGARHVGANVFTALVENPEKEKLTLILEGGRIGGAPLSDSITSSDEIFSIWLSYAVPAGHSADYKFTCTVEQAGRQVLKQTREMHTTPFMKELGDSEAILKEVETLFEKVSDIRGLEERACFLAGRLEKFRPRFFAAPALSDADLLDLKNDFTAFYPELQLLLKMTRAAAIAAEKGSAVLTAAADPWAPFGGVDEIFEGRISDNTLSVEAFPGEHESAALNVFNMSADTVTFRVTLSDLTQGETEKTATEYITLHEAVPVPTEMIDYSVDALPRLNNAALLQVPPRSAVQLWLDINTKGLAPGEWNCKVMLASLQCDSIRTEVPLTVRLYDTALPEEQPLSLCHWGYVERSMLRHIPEKALEDQISHGTNVFVGTIFPQAQYNEQGELVSGPDFSAHDAYVKAHAPHGIILFCGYQHSLRGPGGVNSDAYAKAHKEWLKRWVAHLKELGVGYDGFALYPVDEPGLNDGLVEQYIRMATLAREADPQILLYTDPVMRITEAELEAMVPLVDIWCPHRKGLVLEPSSAKKFEIIRNSGKTVWTYECDDNVKHHSPVGYYRCQAWLAKSRSLTGIGFWSYCTSQDDPWFRPGVRHDYLMVYPGTDVVSSKRWEAVRDGVEDYTLLSLLEKRAEKAEGPLKAEISLFLKETVDAIARYCGDDEDGTLPGPGGEPEVRRVTDRRVEHLKAARREIARYLSLLH